MKGTKQQEFAKIFGDKREVKSLNDFQSYLSTSKDKSVNNFGISFHRNTFDYCDAYWVVIKVGRKYNIIWYTWSKYSGYSYKLCSDEWFDEININDAFLHIGASIRYGHIEFDYNACRGRSDSSHPYTLLPVRKGTGWNFLQLQQGKSALCCQHDLGRLGKFEFDRNLRIYKCKVEFEGKSQWLTINGKLMPDADELQTLLEECKKMTRQQILDEWVAKGKPVIKQNGYSWKGARAHTISIKEAMLESPRYSFGKGYYEMSWEISPLVGGVALKLTEYSESDMW